MITKTVDPTVRLRSRSIAPGALWSLQSIRERPLVEAICQKRLPRPAATVRVAASLIIRSTITPRTFATTTRTTIRHSKCLRITPIFRGRRLGSITIRTGTLMELPTREARKKGIQITRPITFADRLRHKGLAKSPGSLIRVVITSIILILAPMVVPGT